MKEQRVQTLYPDHLSPSQGEDKYILKMTPPKKKLLKSKEVSLDPSLKIEPPIIKLPNNEKPSLMKKMMLDHLPSQTSHYPVR